MNCPYCNDEPSVKDLEVTPAVVCYKCGIQWSGKQVLTTEWNGWHEVPAGALIVRAERQE